MIHAIDMVFFSPTTLAIASSFFAAIAIILARTLLKDLKSRDILGINFFTMAAILLLLSPLFYFFNPTPLSIALLVLVAIIDTVANYFYFKTFEKLEASVAAPIVSLAPAFAFFFSWVFLGDVVSLRTYILAAAVIVAVIVLSSDKKGFTHIRFKEISPALISSLLFGLSAIPSKYLLNLSQTINAPTLYLFRAAMIALLALLFFRFTIKHITVNQYRIITIRSIFVIAQWVLLYYALTYANAGVVVTLGNITPAFVFILAILFLKEKITYKKITAAVLVLVLSFIM